MGAARRAAMAMRRSVSQKLMSAPAVAPGERLWVPRDGAWVKGEVLAQANTLVTLELEDGAEHELDLGFGELQDWRWLDYEDLVAAHYSGDATGLVGRLAAFARVDAADLEDALACFAPSSKTPDVAPRLAATVDLAARTAEAPSPYAPERHV